LGLGRLADSDHREGTVPLLIRQTRPFGLGDVVSFTPASRGIGESMPTDVKVTLRVGRYGSLFLFGRFELEGGDTYVCDDELLTQTSLHGGGTRLAPGTHVVDITVTYDRVGRATARFIIEVPSRESKDRIEWRRARGKWRAVYLVHSG
jgi:hypothetical protein